MTPPSDHDHRAPVTFSKERLGAVYDGVAAITATLLVIELKVPFDQVDSIADLPLLHENAHLLLAWAISFLMIGVIWYEHHLVSANSSRLDTPFIVVAMAQLAMLSLIPFVSALVGGFPSSVVAILVFNAVMFANGALVALQSLMLSRRPHLHRGPEARDLAYRARLQLLVYLAVAVFSIVVAIAHVPLTGILAWALSPLLLSLKRPLSPHPDVGQMAAAVAGE